MATELKEPIVVTLYGDFRKEFKTLNDIDSWVQEQLSFYQPLGQRRSNYQPHQSLVYVLQEYNKILSNIKQTTNAYRGATTKSDVEKLHNHLRALLEKFENGSFLHNRHPIAKVIIDKITEGTDVSLHFAAGVFYAASVPHSSGNTASAGDPMAPLPLYNHTLSFLSGFIYGTLLRLGLYVDIATERRYLEELREEYTQSLHDFSMEMITIKDQHQSLFRRIEQLYNDIKALYKRRRKRITFALIKFLNNKRDQIERLEKFYHDKLAIEASEKYWGELFDKNTENASWYMKLLIGYTSILFGASVIVLWIYWDKISSFLTNYTGNPIIFSLFMLFVIALLFLPARVFYKLWLHNQAISSDALYRIKLTQSYLALSEHKAAPTPDERLLMLQALFRPGPDLEARGDAGPGMLSELALSKLLEKFRDGR